MIKISESNYYQIYYDERNMLAEIYWLPTVEEVSISRGIELTNDVFKILVELRPKLLLQVVKEVVYTYTEEYQDYVANNLTPKAVEVGIEKIAYVLSRDFITNLGLQMLNEKALRRVPDKIKRAFFYEENEARRWLLDR